MAREVSKLEFIELWENDLLVEIVVIGNWVCGKKRGHKDKNDNTPFEIVYVVIP